MHNQCMGMCGDHIIKFYTVMYLCRAFLIPLNNQVQGPYCKLLTEIFPVHLWPKHKVHGPYRKSMGKKRGCITYSMEKKNKVSKIITISMKLIRSTGKGTF